MDLADFNVMYKFTLTAHDGSGREFFSTSVSAYRALFKDAPQQPECKTTLSGVFYVGYRNRANNGKNCLRWYDQLVRDKDFPDGSASAAKNYCKNPHKSPNGPWCYTGK